MDEGDAEEFRKMDMYKAYDRVQEKGGEKILDADRIRTRKLMALFHAGIAPFQRGDPSSEQRMLITPFGRPFDRGSPRNP